MEEKLRARERYQFLRVATDFTLNDRRLQREIPREILVLGKSCLYDAKINVNGL